MSPYDVLPGMKVSYSPSPGHEFSGLVAEYPWVIGDGQWVTKLVDMEEGYARFTGKKGDKAHTVFAASLCSMRPINSGARIYAAHQADTLAAESSEVNHERNFMIAIRKSSTADNRSCDKTLVTKEQLLHSSAQHIGDVGKGLAFFAGKLTEAASVHDYDKLTEIDWFLADFKGDMCKPMGWLARHYQIHRHHLGRPPFPAEEEIGVPEDVNLLDVLEMVADCVMAGMSRAGSVFPIVLSDELLQRALANTTELLKSQIVVEE